MSGGPTRIRQTRGWRRGGRAPRLAVLAAAAILLPAIAWAAGKQPKGTDGPYRVTVRGWCEGEGTATVGGKRVKIHAKVEDEAGNKGNLNAAGMELVGDHFEGTGTVMGSKATFVGRLDGYDGDKKFRGARVLCTFTDASGRTGRVAGVVGH